MKSVQGFGSNEEILKSSPYLAASLTCTALAEHVLAEACLLPDKKLSTRGQDRCMIIEMGSSR